MRDVVEYLFDQMQPHGITRGEWVFPDNLPIYKRPYPIHTSAYREMDLLSRSHKFYWSIQNGKLEIIPSNKSLGHLVTVSKSSGMIGIPTITDTWMHC